MGVIIILAVIFLFGMAFDSKEKPSKLPPFPY